MNFADKDGFIWLDGQWLDWRDAQVHVCTNTLHYGLGAFEGIRAYHTSQGTAVFRLKEHLDRLNDSAKLIHVQMPYTQAELQTVCTEAIKKNNLKEAYLRPLVFLGSEGMGLHAKNLLPHVMIAAWEWGVYLGSEALTKGVRIKTSSFRRNHIESIHPRGKINGHYVNSMLALREVQFAGYDEALLLDHRGFVAEGSGENFFIVKNGEVLTPAPESILLGITRDTIMQLCKDLSIPVREINVTRDAVYLADEAFFTGTAAEVTPIREVDNHQIGEGKPGPITLKLQEAYFDVVKGKNPKYAHWLTPVA